MEKYKGFTITIESDDDISNMFWEDMRTGADGSIVYVYGNRDMYESDDDAVLARIQNEFDKKGIKKNIEEYCYYHILSEELRDTLKSSYYEVGDGLNEMVNYLDEDYIEDSIDLLLLILQKLHIKHDWYESRGYSQGDYLKVLLVEKDGFMHNREYIDACLWGGFISYRIENEQTELDGSSGYVIEEEAINDAKEEIDFYLEKQKEKKQAKLKKLIVNKVPLSKRGNILNGIK